jgi:NAD(P)-dependent dehydrogenase (short-subunit alcohol dehydrogenase family)
MNSKKETVLITGCSSGIGYATAELAILHGHTVIATAIDEAELAKVPEGAALKLVLDVCDSESVENAISQAEQQLGAISVLVNNAGVCQPGPVELLSDKQLQKQFDINVFGIVRTSRAVLPSMRANKRGTIINVSSILGRITMPLVGAYCASKYAVEAISDALRMECQSMGIRVHLIEPGWIRSNFSATAESLASEALHDVGPYDALIASSAAKQADAAAYEGTPEQVAKAIVCTLEKANCRARIPVTFMARVFLSFSFLPTRWRDKLIMKMVA